MAINPVTGYELEGAKSTYGSKGTEKDLRKYYQQEAKPFFILRFLNGNKRKQHG